MLKRQTHTHTPTYKAPHDPIHLHTIPNSYKTHPQVQAGHVRENIWNSQPVGNDCAWHSNTESSNAQLVSIVKGDILLIVNVGINFDFHE